MSSLALFLIVLGLAALGWLMARARAMAFRRVAGGQRAHSLPNYHGWYVALWAALPALIFLAIWTPVSGNLVSEEVMSSPAASSLPPFEMQRMAILREAREIAEGDRPGGFNPQSSEIAPIYKSALSRYRMIGAVVALLLAFAGGAFAFTRVSPHFRART